MTPKVRTVLAPAAEVQVRSRVVHGYRRVFRIAGEGPAVLLIHGIGDSSQIWSNVIPALARNHLVIAPDLLGHGESDKPRADYSVPAYANGMRDLLGAIGVDRVTLVGHSLGGGVAMQFAYQFPEKTDRLVLVASGGVGRQVNPLLRAVSLPGADLMLSLVHTPAGRIQLQAVLKVLSAVDSGIKQDAADVFRVIEGLPDTTARSAFIRTLRAVVDWRGQVVTMLDRCYLTAGMPTMLVWGSKDRVVPLRHAYRARDAMPGSRLEIFDGAGHFPFRAEPQRFITTLEEFLSTTEPANWSPEQWRELLREGRQGRPIPDQGGALPEDHVQSASERSAT